MFGPHKLSIFSCNRLPHFFSFTSFTSFASRSSTSSFARILPIFSTRSKHLTRRNPRNSFPFTRILHTSPHTPGEGTPHLAIYPSPLVARRLSLLEATHARPSATTDSKPLTEMLSRLSATLTKNQGGARAGKVQGARSPDVVVHRFGKEALPTLAPFNEWMVGLRHVFLVFHQSPVTSHQSPPLDQSPPPMKRTSRLLRHTPCTRYPVPVFPNQQRAITNVGGR
jgi:hypothetical protein